MSDSNLFDYSKKKKGVEGEALGKIYFFGELGLRVLNLYNLMK